MFFYKVCCVLSKASNLSHRMEEAPLVQRMLLKWFNGAKGFGFVVPEDEGFDAFFHVTTLQKTGVHAVGEGAVLLCSLCQSEKGYQVKEILEVIDQGNVMAMPEESAQDGVLTIGGIVKWFKPEKSFGFIIPDDGLKDIFVHQSLLDKLEIETLKAGDRVQVTLKAVNKGREAVDIKVIG
jgi:CspA family cold shock protein